MRLDKVELSGFKSFCDKQEIDFRGGVTGIVGPNGCGKSNISDAISWVLGEQSVKSLRGSSMEDVIFAGSQARQPVGMAEVNLKVSGLNGNSPDGHPECTVTRRLYRNGESEYLMNGTVCRLRDIHELFMDTGLGSKAYSIIEQGKIGLILSSKPADRRALIEEAAGVTKYKLRRRQTALKLEAAQQNLLRVNDIVHEVEKQLESLKRQASKARRYKVVQEELKGVERVLFGRRFLDLQDQADRLSSRLKDEAEREQAASLALGAEEAQMEVQRTRLYEEEARLEAVRSRLAELTLAVDRHQGRSGYCKEQIAETETRRGETAREASDLEARVEPLSEMFRARRAEEASQKEQLVAAEGASRGADKAVHDASSAQAAREAELDLIREAQVVMAGRLAALQNARESVLRNAERAGADLLKLASEGEELRREEVRVADLQSQARKRDAGALALLDALRGERAAAESRAALARARAGDLAAEGDGRQSERDSLAGRLSSLEEMVATHSAFDEGVRAVLARPAGIEVLGVVADAVETGSDHEKAVEAFLGDRLQAVLTPDAAQALRGIRHLQESGAGRGTFLPLSQARTKTECGPLKEIAREEPRVKGLLSELYRVTGPHEAAIRGSLPDALVVESLEDGLAIVARQGPVACVTLAGETIRGSMVEGGRGVKGLLAPRREVREIGVRLVEVEGLLAAVLERQRAEADRAEAAQSEARVLEERIHDAEKELVAIRHDAAAADEESLRLRRKASILATERGQAEQEKTDANDRFREIEEALTAAEAERAQGSARLAALQAAVSLARAETESAQARSAEARSLLAALRERSAASQAECLRLEGDLRDLEERIAAARARESEMARRGEELARELKECEQKLVDALSVRDRSTGEVALVEDAVRDLRNELEGRELSLKERRRERETLRDALSELTVLQARCDSDREHLVRECQQAVGQPPAEAARDLTDDERLAEIAGLEARAQDVRERLERMGAVNILAVEQSQEFEERHQFLTAQRQDLLDSIAELDQAIKKIDRASKERFQEAFQVINQHFGEVFRQLFGGGTAGLSLIDEEDILESGIDVMAQPPGKRLQSVMLLSGGEKALTAIALLFAIFQYKPSPFCILDEVDAPLDDANIGRFVRMLEGLKEQTQFVLITHSRKTMEIADQLYGVTMEEPGVSKLVSVKFG
jgi:chromosome segregation protein